MELLVLLLLLILLALASWRWGVDSRASRGWTDEAFVAFTEPADRR